MVNRTHVDKDTTKADVYGNLLGPDMSRMLVSPLVNIATLATFSFAFVSLVACGKPAEPGTETTKAQTTQQVEAEQTPPPPPLSAAELEQLYVDGKTRYEATAKLPDESFTELRADLMRVANEAPDPHLRANASLLLGSMHEDRNDQRAAISFYRQAQQLIPNEVAPSIVLALALSKDKRWDEAITEQWKVVEMIPDDLTGWLLLGEMHVKAGKLDEAAEVYGAHELRRKGLLDGLTLKQNGEYVTSEDDRVACADALAPAVDNGTALALMYALDSDPSPKVRAQVVAIMGEQRLIGYQKLLESKLATETDADVKQAIEWALAEIARDGVETAPGAVPEEIAKQVEAAVAAAQAEAKQGGETGGGETGEPAGDDKPADDGEVDDCKPAGDGEFGSGKPAGDIKPDDGKKKL